MHTVGTFLENKLNVFNVGIIHSLVFFNQKLYMSIKHHRINSVEIVAIKYV